MSQLILVFKLCYSGHYIFTQSLILFMRNEKIKVNKAKLIEKIRENKENHQKEFKEAVEAYKKEAMEQLDKQVKKLANGDTDLSLDLVTPEDKTREYDKLITLFEWELEETVLLTQSEFNQYIMDETDFAVLAKLRNTTYISKFSK